MTADTRPTVSVSEAQEDFARVLQIAQTGGEVMIMEDGKPRYLLTDIEKSPIMELSDDEKIDIAAARVLKKYKPAFLELAK